MCNVAATMDDNNFQSSWRGNEALALLVCSCALLVSTQCCRSIHWSRLPHRALNVDKMKWEVHADAAHTTSARSSVVGAAEARRPSA
jgi:hypothetical protein